MKVIIAGSRSIKDYDVVKYAIHNCPFVEQMTEIISGGAIGVDSLGEEFARECNIPLTIVRANWEEDGKSAGFIRNRKMVSMADGLIALWDGKSKGTEHTIKLAQARQAKFNDIQIYIRTYE